MSKKKPPAFIPCTIKMVPKHLEDDAAKTAIEINPVNAPVGGVPISRIGAFTSKYWGAKGVDLSVAFLETIANDLRDRILSHLNSWAIDGRANVRFRWTASASSARIRITRSGGGYWSYLGTDVMQIPVNEPTMSLQSFSMSTPESEYKRVVRHEAGHTLGFPHEHLRRALVARLDEAKTIAYFGRTYGWSPDEVRQQVLTPINEASLLTPTPEDETSIMCYQLPGEITKDGRPIPGGADIDAGDADYCSRIYPVSVEPPPPPPPSGQGGRAWIEVQVAAGTFAFNYEGRQCSGRFINDAGRTIAGTWSG